MAFNILKSTDTDAPVLNPTAGSLITLLDACLVDGYGSDENAKEPLGWTKAQTGTNRAVYQMGGGSQQLIGVVDANTINASLYAASAASSATDIGSMWSNSDASESNINKTDFTGILPLHWMVIGDEKGAFILTRRLSQGAWNMVWFGDIDSYESADPDRCLFMPQTSILSGVSHSTSNGPKLASGNKESFNIRVFNDNSVNRVTSAPEVFANSEGEFDLENDFGVGLLMSRIQIYSTTRAYDAPYGTMRGIRRVMTSRDYTDFLSRVDSINGAGSDAGKTFMPVAIGDHVNNYGGVPNNDKQFSFVLIQTSEW